MCTENKCLLDKRQGQKGPLNHNDFMASIWRGFLYTATMQPGPILTLGDLQRATPCVWLWCERWPTTAFGGKADISRTFPDVCF